jgi:hypothetical protein
MVILILEIAVIDRPSLLIEIGPDSARRSSDLAPYNRLGGKAYGRNE